MGVRGSLYDGVRCFNFLHRGLELPCSAKHPSHVRALSPLAIIQHTLRGGIETVNCIQKPRILSIWIFQPTSDRDAAAMQRQGFRRHAMSRVSRREHQSLFSRAKAQCTPFAVRPERLAECIPRPGLLLEKIQAGLAGNGAFKNNPQLDPYTNRETGNEGKHLGRLQRDIGSCSPPLSRYGNLVGGIPLFGNGVPEGPLGLERGQCGISLCLDIPVKAREGWRVGSGQRRVPK